MTNSSTSRPEKLPPALAAVVPCYNAGPRLRPVLEGLAGVVDRPIVVDDGSTDGCVEAVRDLRVEIVTLQPNRGKGHAMLAGFRAALDRPSVTHVAILDADGQHDPAELGRLYEVARKGADLVIGTRAFGLEQVPWRSRFGNRLTSFLTRVLFGRAVADTQSGYRLHSRRLVDEILRALPGGRYETEMRILALALRGRYTVEAVPIRTIYETGNASSHFDHVRDSIRIYRALFRAAFHRPSDPRP